MALHINIEDRIATYTCDKDNTIAGAIANSLQPFDYKTIDVLGRMAGTIAGTLGEKGKTLITNASFPVSREELLGSIKLKKPQDIM